MSSRQRRRWGRCWARSRRKVIKSMVPRVEPYLVFRPTSTRRHPTYAQQLARHPEAIKQAVALALKLGEMIQAQKETVGLNRGGRPTKKLGQAVTRFPVPPLLPRASTSTAGLPHASSCWEGSHAAFDRKLSSERLKIEARLVAVSLLVLPVCSMRLSWLMCSPATTLASSNVLNPSRLLKNPVL
jgi:hypothetical protein